MTALTSSPAVPGLLHHTTIELLASLRDSEDEPIDSVTIRSAEALQREAIRSEPTRSTVPLPLSQADTHPQESSSVWPTNTTGWYSVEVVGEPLRACTLYELFGIVVDLIHCLDPAVIERLSRYKARTRRYVAREKAGIHAGRTDLPVHKTRSGWWVSAKIGTRDLERALRALCTAAELAYRVDIKFGT